MRHSVLSSPPRSATSRLVLSGVYVLSAVAGLVYGTTAHQVLAAVLLVAGLAGTLSVRAVRRSGLPRRASLAEGRRHA
ncbi:hypothetical protein [Streptomyces minutiscleroticus]|uniref:Uncharacterized protein n=1 Tax=Streptomyces minutiscleroticus TaxID=68238 RepID=A0A918NDG4_9ACTN|nr:hypothetical protein [Streptomyces minutiscleroticus]GGX59305.1 hypothetical protein GCM10010358_12100 [Streptomyces minutiscleroticus]